MIGTALFLVFAPAIEAGCADGWAVELNTESFSNNGAGKTFSSPQLAQFRDRVDAKLKAVIGAACRNGAVPIASAKSVKKVSVVSASGATEPHLYSNPEGILLLEWIFAEENLGIPPAEEILNGATCWLKPKEASCGAEGD